MKIINAETDFLAFQKIFRYLKANHCSLVVWQSENGKREVSNSNLNSFHHESKLLHCDLKASANFNPAFPIFCYVEDGQLIFKTSIHELTEKYISLVMPQEIKFIEEADAKMVYTSLGMEISTFWSTKRLNLEELDDGSDYVKIKSMAQRSSRDQDFLNHEFDGVSIDEEDQIFADKRESPRARPKSDKWVKVQLADAESFHNLKLFDLSRGGMSFVSTDNEAFPKGEVVHILGFDEFDLDDPLIGQVMSLRPINDDQFEWKVGVKFDEGQD